MGIKVFARGEKILLGTSVTIEKVVVRHIRMRLRKPFKTSFGVSLWRDIVIVEFHSEDIIGYGESVADNFPGYSYETHETVLLVLRNFLIPRILKGRFDSPYAFRESLEIIRGHPIAKASLEYAFWDLYAKILDKPLYELYRGTKKKVLVGVSIGIKEDIPQLLSTIQYYLDQGYKRIKLKISPGYDIEVLNKVRETYPDINLQVDANAAYDVSKHLEILIRLDDFNLIMVEQPLHYEDLVDHSVLRSELSTPICLDESIASYHLARAAIKLKSCDIINIKPPRVGGIIESLRIYDLCTQCGIGTWIGGMLETGIGKAHLLHVATLPNIGYPSDISASDRYWEEDIINPPHKLNPDSTIDVPKKPGIGVDVDLELVEKYQIRSWEFK